MANRQYEVASTYDIPYQFIDLVIRRTSALITAGNAQTMTLAGLLQNAYVIGMNDAIEVLQNASDAGVME